MIVIWTPEAEQDRMDIWMYIASDDPVAASRMDSHFSKAAFRLEAYPEIGKVGQIAGTREIFPHKSYRLIYQVEDDMVWILTIMHTARQWPPVHCVGG